MPATAKIIELKGNPKNPESAEHIIIFPGGSISVCRTSNNEYWAHMEVNTDEVIPDTVRQSKPGRVVDTRIDRTFGNGTIEEVSDPETIRHIAIRISTKEDQGS